MSLLEISHLTTKFETQQGTVSAVRDVSYHLEEGEVLGIVGESGSGKSVGMLSLMGLLADNGRIVSGSIIFDGEEISPISEKYKNNKKAYEKSEINLLELVEKDAKNHDFSSVNETTKLIRELRKLKNGE